MKNLDVNSKRIVAILVTTSLVLMAKYSNSNSTSDVNNQNKDTVTSEETQESTTTNDISLTYEESENYKDTEPEVIASEEQVTTKEEVKDENKQDNTVEVTQPELTQPEPIVDETNAPDTLEIYEPNNNVSNEDEVISFLENVSNKADEWTLSDKFSSVKEDVTSGVATFILFMSGDSTIGGYTFSSLTEAGKQKVEVLFMKMDNKLENKFPGYKNKIGEKWNVVKKFTSEKYNIIKNKVKNYIVEKVGEENYEEALNNFSAGFEDMKDSFSNTFDYIGDKAGDLKDKVIDWAKEKEKVKVK